MNDYLVSIIGEKAKKEISGTDFSGKILAVLSSTIYLVDNKNELLWLGNQRTLIHRRCLYLQGRLPEVNVNSSFLVKKGLLIFEKNLTLNLQHANVWNHNQISKDLISPVRDLRSNYQELLEYINRIIDRKGFGFYIPLLNNQIINYDASFILNVNDPFLKFANHVLPDIINSCRKLDFKAVSNLGQKLIGLGSGLTPSGDDFLGGLFFAFNQFKKVDPNAYKWMTLSLNFLKNIVLEQTNLISSALFRDLASGFAIEPIHLFMDGFLSGKPIEKISCYLSDITHVGHSTGWDMLTGLLCGLLPLIN